MRLSLTTNQRNPGCLVIAGNTGNNTSFTNLLDSRVKTEMVELQQLFDSVEAKQYKRPDMNEDLRLGFASDDFAGTKWTGTARWSDGTEMLSPHQRALGSVQGLPGPAGRGGSLAPAGAEEAIRNMATPAGEPSNEDPQHLQRGGEGVSGRPPGEPGPAAERLQQLRASRAHEPAATWPCCVA